MTNFLQELPEDLDSSLNEGRTSGAWTLLVVDDDSFVHEMTRYVLSEVTFENQSLRIVSAFSGAEARQILTVEADVAVILLDVIMETESAGLDLVTFIRAELHNKDTQIVVRTGQSGQLKERDIVTNFEINDYRAKSGLTAQDLYNSVICALRGFRNLKRAVERTDLSE